MVVKPYPELTKVVTRCLRLLSSVKSELICMECFKDGVDCINEERAGKLESKVVHSLCNSSDISIFMRRGPL